ncbi:ATP-dependent helicase [Curtobacterium flaccumfaciens pv. flaccumfaciens]|uniref:UvrD-helicase domain-containing protein n=1 Tax=Curtobacterium flaccumfaciens TaxID=2035 RepID=UPI001ADABBEC|nr:ATP-dependent helicase [Curtobacterium flaccumfaciens]MBO9046044.1 ATP-dependent helicase [Curtobacterium flaccumfaciens pv. flaccumfaciens]QTR90801.1 ATP-dependent helicase [Curtobacterium flaccumfaciens pv. flaccumfaciens]QVG66121.1 ATP-dependent helicase [Curtobacterium flaccumfaciens pv. flaccumfaciens]
MIDPADWEATGGFSLEPNARSAATEQTRNTFVSAGPGTGKTEMLAQRADFLLRTGFSPYPRRILALSFKVDAARNLRERVRARTGASGAARVDSLTFAAFAKRFVDNFLPALQGPDRLDPDYALDEKVRVAGRQITFDDLVPLAVKILDKNDFAARVTRKAYGHVFLDEFQDTTGPQYELLRRLFQDGDAVVTAVGDFNQRIMGWVPDASDDVLDHYTADFDAVPFTLYQNRRSAPEVRRVVNRIVADLDETSAVPADEIAGDEGTVRVLAFDSDREEADAVAGLIRTWLDDGVPMGEIAVLIRQQPHLLGQQLMWALERHGIAFRNEQVTQNSLAEPLAELIVDFLRVVTGDREPDAYSRLLRLSSRLSTTEEAALRFDSRIKRFLRDSTSAARDAEGSGIDDWRTLVENFLTMVGRPTVNALSAAYTQGNRYYEIIDDTLMLLEERIVAGDGVAAAVRRLAEPDAIRVLTIHKCKGLEFEKVIVLGVEHETFWSKSGKERATLSEFFVAASRAKAELVLTHAGHRSVDPIPYRWEEWRTPFEKYLAYAAG